jgi:hypothetical protein
MYTVIDADCILANLLQNHEQVTTRELNEVRTAIESKIPSVYVDVTGNCIVWAVNQCPDMFSLQDNIVKRMRRWTESDVEKSFNWRIPLGIRQSVLDALKTETSRRSTPCPESGSEVGES